MSTSDEEGSVQSAELSPRTDRLLRPLPKRARLDPSSSGKRARRKLDAVVGLPALSDPSSNSSSSATDGDAPCTPPALQYYQPLFAPVDALVKQVAATTTLFGGLSLRGDPSKRPTAARDEDDVEDDVEDEHEYEDRPKLSSPTDATARRNRAAHPAAYRASDDHDSPSQGSNKKKRKVPATLEGRPTQSDAEEDDIVDDARAAATVSDEAEADEGADQLAALPAARAEASAPPEGISMGIGPLDHKGAKRSRSTISSTSPGSGHSPSRRRRLPPPAAAAAAGLDAEATPTKLGSNGQPARKTLKPDGGVEPTTAAEAAAAGEGPPVKPAVVLHNLYQPDAGPLYLGAGVVPSPPRAQPDPPPEPADLPAVPFSFHAPLSTVLLTRLEDMNREQERLQLARELVKERARELELTKKRAELEEAVRQNEQALAELKPATASVGVQADGDLSGGWQVLASRWSTKEASQPLQRPPRKPVGPVAPAPAAAPTAAGAAAAADEHRKAPPRKGKKKRSAYANANNAHHRDNYVPSRQPRAAAAASGHHAGAGGPPPVAYMMEELPSLGLVADDAPFSTANAHAQLGQTRLAPFFATPDEWLCAWCELDVLFGDADRFARCVKKRTTVLKIRRRAQRRAKRAASGQALTKEQQKQKAKQKAARNAPAPAAAPSDRKNAATQTVPFEEMHLVGPAAPASAPAAGAAAAVAPAAAAAAAVDGSAAGEEEEDDYSGSDIGSDEAEAGSELEEDYDEEAE